MSISLQPVLETNDVILLPLEAGDFDELYLVAADPAIWEQHPRSDRWKKDAFTRYFEKAVAGGGSFKIVSKPDMQTIGSTRYYDYNEALHTIFIGYTFFKVACWGTGVNMSVKRLMLDYIFQDVERVFLNIWEQNLRSRIAAQKLGAQEFSAPPSPSFQQGDVTNILYGIEKKDWLSRIK